MGSDGQCAWRTRVERLLRGSLPLTAVLKLMRTLQAMVCHSVQMVVDSLALAVTQRAARIALVLTVPMLMTAKQRAIRSARTAAAIASSASTRHAVRIAKALMGHTRRTANPKMLRPRKLTNKEAPNLSRHALLQHLPVAEDVADSPSDSFQLAVRTVRALMAHMQMTVTSATRIRALQTKATQLELRLGSEALDSMQLSVCGYILVVEASLWMFHSIVSIVHTIIRGPSVHLRQTLCMCRVRAVLFSCVALIFI